MRIAECSRTCLPVGRGFSLREGFLRITTAMLYALCWTMHPTWCMAIWRKGMRHPERELKDKETVVALLEKASVGRIATVNQKGVPVIKPVNFLYWNGKVYIHSSTRGEKIKDIRRGSAVCFEVDEPIAFVTARGNACSGNYYFRSILIKGSATLVRRVSRKLEIFERLMEKYQPEKDYGKLPEEILKKTAIIEISIQEITAKERLG